MRLPLVTYCAQTSANVPHATQRVHSVASCTRPSASFQRALVATLKVVRAVPVAVYVTAGSCPRWPMRCTRSRSFMVIPPFAPRVKKESSDAFRKAQQAKTGVNGARARRPTADVFISTLAAEGGAAPSACLAKRLHPGCPCECQRAGQLDALRTAVAV